ncbi:M23 family metallopeptidase [Psychrobacter sp. FDAARGOS_221]|uniref:M23 family metallopeptidase n=1 Tax=Psychrobacter sp. FDAARGOS_221 TaxID=1975705 RepID=UPI000BB52E54|nr:M23 family metallopeptidase [Psychrobacter sp. FDAARGOS_221]PNK60272.1 M23 family peptidase [Psychrobacter sp. FDAARGOS_221]
MSNLPTRPSQPKRTSFVGRLIRFAIKTVLLVVVLYAVVIVSTDIKHEVALSRMTQTLSLPFKYSQLLQQDPPQPNSLPNPITDAGLTDTWGAARSNGRRHEGIDIFAERGTPILSTTPGIVRRVGTNELGGNVVSIVGPGGVGHYYAHLEEFADITEGDWVETGDVIGYVGDSGNAKGTPPHLHYGIYIDSSAVNPYPLLKK